VCGSKTRPGGSGLGARTRPNLSIGEISDLKSSIWLCCRSYGHSPICLPSVIRIVVGDRIRFSLTDGLNQSAVDSLTHQIRPDRLCPLG